MTRPGDVDAVHAGERIPTLEAIGQQAADLYEEPDPALACPCGAEVTLTTSFRCFYCEVWFCRSCAEDHFEDGDRE